MSRNLIIEITCQFINVFNIIYSHNAVIFHPMHILMEKTG